MKGFVVFNGQKNFADFDLWLKEFQKGINKFVEGEFLQIYNGYMETQ